jgi:hypothetical protein
MDAQRLGVPRFGCAPKSWLFLNSRERLVHSVCFLILLSETSGARQARKDQCAYQAEAGSLADATTPEGERRMKLRQKIANKY